LERLLVLAFFLGADPFLRSPSAAFTTSCRVNIPINSAAACLRPMTESGYLGIEISKSAIYGDNILPQRQPTT
jgi:hypothetical protein